MCPLLYQRRKKLKKIQPISDFQFKPVLSVTSKNQDQQIYISKQRERTNSNFKVWILTMSSPSLISEPRLKRVLNSPQRWFIDWLIMDCDTLRIRTEIFSQLSGEKIPDEVAINEILKYIQTSQICSCYQRSRGKVWLYRNIAIWI